jgi:hypothetical protein
VILLNVVHDPLEKFTGRADSIPVFIDLVAEAM